MGGMDRRAFLFGAFRGPDAPEPAPAGAKPEPGAIIRIGRWRDFPIGESKMIEPQGILIESHPEGLRARSGSRGGECFGISADSFGELAVDPSEIWNEGMVYSIMVAGPVRLESPLEENNERR